MKTIIIDADSLCYVGGEDTIEIAIEKLESKINKIKRVCNSDDLIMYLTIGKTFRNVLLETYKGNREQSKRSDNVKLLKNYLIEKYNAIYEEGLEADDLVMDKYREDMNKYIICSIDKDILKNIEGRHLNLYNYEFKTITKEEAFDNLHIQTIIGDPTDNIPTLMKGIGPAKLKVLKHLTGLSYEEISKYICHKKEMNYTTRYRLLYCGRSEDIKLIENKIEYNEIIDSYIETGKYIIKKTEKTKLKNKVKIEKSTNKYTPDSMAPGKHKDKTWLEVSKQDPNYIKWMISATKDKELKNMLQELLDNN